MKPIHNRRIAFLGGKPLSARCLQLLFEHHRRKEIEIVAVLPRPYGEMGWWSGPGIPEIADTALSLGLNVIEHEGQLAAMNLDLLLSVLYFRILPPSILARPRHGCLNLHCAPLPHYRGCNSGTHAILNGETRFGVTLHYMDEKVDHGDVVEVREFEIPASATARQLMVLTEAAALALFRDRLPDILGGRLEAISQDEIVRRNGIPSRYYPRSSLTAPDIREVDLTATEAMVLRKVRAFEFPPFEPAYARIAGQKVYMTLNPASGKTDLGHVPSFPRPASRSPRTRPSISVRSE